MPLSFSLCHAATALFVAGALSFSVPAFADSIAISSGTAVVTYDNTQTGHPNMPSGYAGGSTAFNSGTASTVSSSITSGPLMGASYISYDPATFSDGMDNGGMTAYTTLFSGNYLGGSGSITLAADDNVVAFLNGHQIGTTSGTSYNTIIGPTAFSGYLLNGQNVLTFDVTNANGTSTYGGPTDLAFKFNAVSATPEPSSLALLGTGILSVAGVMRKKIIA